MAFSLPALPYGMNDLASSGMSAETLEYHYGKHHKTYVDNLNKLVAGTDLENQSLENVIQSSFKDGKVGIFNNAAQIWNHTFFWNGLKPNGGGLPTGDLAARIDKDFGSFAKFVEELSNAALTQFGSGWAWLVEDNGTLKVMKTPNAENPMVHGKKALLTIDVWEHAYYIDFRNARAGFVKNVLEKLVNWDFVAANLAG